VTENSDRKGMKSVPDNLSVADRLLTLREAAEFLRLHPRTVREYLRRGELDARLIGGQWRFRRKDLDAFFENAPRGWDFDGKGSHGD
jgi:excisionase family DNA binding protein